MAAAAKSKRGRKRHVQQELCWHGGKRKGAGRKPVGARAGTSHKKRPEIDPAQALHVVLRVSAAVGGMRRRNIYRAIRAASIIAAVRGRFRIVHISIQQTHVHMLIEAENKLALARGMLGFQVSAARHINAALGDELLGRRRGRVFVDRYHVPPRSWVLSVGWERAGTISAREVPSGRRH